MAGALSNPWMGMLAGQGLLAPWCSNLLMRLVPDRREVQPAPAAA